MRDSKRDLSTMAFVGCLWVALILGCSQLKEISNSGQTTSPAASPPTNMAATSSPSRSATHNSQINTGTPASTVGVTMANFNRLQKGMPYAEVVKILGKEGKEEGVLGSGAEKIVMYKWDADEDGSGATMSAFFKDGKLDTKFQFALK